MPPPVTQDEHYAALKIAWKSYHLLADAMNLCKPILDGRCHGCAQLAAMEAERCPE